MLYGVRGQWLPVVVVVMLAAVWSGCQSTTSTSSTLAVDDFVAGESFPNPAAAEASSGKFYRVVRGNNQPDDIIEYKWKTSFKVNVTINSKATDSSVDLKFPTTITSTSVKVEQASGGIVITPTGGETEHYESAITSTTGNTYTGVNQNLTLAFDVWYDTPNKLKEALATVIVSFRDNDGKTFAKTVTCRIQ